MKKRDLSQMTIEEIAEYYSVNKSIFPVYDGEIDYRLVIVDQSGNTRAALKALLGEAFPDRRIEERSSLARAGSFGEGEPSIILMNLHDWPLNEEPCQQEIGAARAMPRSKLVVMSGRTDWDSLRMALTQGCVGFVPMHARAAAMLDAIEVVAAGGVYLPPKDDDGLVPQSGARTNDASAAPKPPGASQMKFSPRQQEILEALREGLPNKLIAHRLGIEECTVKVHLRSIMRKLNVNSRTAVAVYATQAATLSTDRPNGEDK
jgi:DNA-binding NarL/FixJ family response regulator